MVLAGQCVAWSLLLILEWSCMGTLGQEVDCLVVHYKSSNLTGQQLHKLTPQTAQSATKSISEPVSFGATCSQTYKVEGTHALQTLEGYC